MPSAGQDTTAHARLEEAAARVLALEQGNDTVAAGIEQTLTKLAHHMARLLGDLAIHTLIDRSLDRTRTYYPWLGQLGSGDKRWEPLIGSIENQDPKVATAAFIHLFATFVALVGAFIGEALVSRLMHEVWPGVFAYSRKKEPP